MTQAAVAGRASGAPWQAWPFGLRGARRLRHALFSLFIVAILGYGAAFAWYMLERFDLIDLLREVNLDDAFYYFQIAYHMAEGRFSTVDGGLTRTNGYHPLWMFLLTPFYWAFDKIEALFAVKAFEIVLMAAGVALAVVAARVARLPWILLFAVLPSLYVQPGMLWGLEAALGLFALGLLLLAACLFARHPARWRWPLAIIVFALPWVRLEYVAIAVAASAMLGFLEWTGRFALAPAAAPSEPLRAPSDRTPWRLNAALPLAGSSAGILAYFAYNGVVFGGVVPVSGTIKAIAAQEFWLGQGGYDLAKGIKLAAQHDVFNDGVTIALEICVYALVVWWFSRSSRGREDVLLLAFLAALSSLAAGHLAMFAHYALFMHPGFFFEWYYVPAYLMDALVIPLRCCVGIYFLRRLLGPRLPRLSDVLRWAAIVAAGGVLAAKADLAAPFRAVDKARAASVYSELPSVFASRIDPKVKPFGALAYMSALVMNRLLPEDTVLGSWDSGIGGYFSRFPVMNLDGLANSYAYREAIDDHAQRAFWRQHGVFNVGNGFADWAALRMPTLWEEVVFLRQAEPVLRRAAPLGLGFDLRVEHDHLVYAKTPCTHSHIANPFFLHVFPASRDDLPEGADFFENRDFWFDRVGGLIDGACLARVPLPDYDIDHIRTGQLVTEVDFLFKSARGSRLLQGLQFKLYREEWSSAVDRAAWFRERMTPHLELQADGTGLLLEGRAAQAFAWECTANAENVAEWSFGGKVGAITDWTQTAEGLCAAAVVLPHGHLEPVRVRRAALDDAVAGWAEGQPPAIRADSWHTPGFDVHVKEDALLYVKAACQQADVETPFYLHLVPLDDDFDEGRELAGYNNLDFMFRYYGDWLGEAGGEGPCVAEVALPSYGIAEIRTGQYAPDDFRILWEGTIQPRHSGQRKMGAET